MSRLALLPLVALIGAVALADGPKDNLPDNVRPIPPKGVPVPAADKQELAAGVAAFADDLKTLPDTPQVRDLLPDVEIYLKAVRYAMEYDEFFTPKDIPAAKAQLKTGRERLAELKAGKPSWIAQTGLVVRGYRSRIDGSVQPYGLVIPKEYDFAGTQKHRLDFWWHGRGETLGEVNFIEQRSKSAGEFTPPGALVLHPYGRYCNANKFAGEVDTFECLEHAKKHYRIDDGRIVARGFSMGGAACWQFATHFPFQWVAAAPGAGFAETPEFLNIFQNEKVEPTWYEKKLWHLYNATDYAENLFNLPTVAYSGADDKQKQAADVMAREMKKVGLELPHIIGPKTGHKYEPGAKAELNKQIDAFVAKGREPAKEIRFVTYTLRYNDAGWVTLLGLGRHWEPARVEGKRSVEGDKLRYRLTTRNVSAFSVTPPVGMKGVLDVDGQGFTMSESVVAQQPRYFRKGSDGRWTAPIEYPIGPHDKRPGVQGPIDDAFYDRFVNVRPTGSPMHEKTGAWVRGEMKHAIEHWRKQFRGDAPVVDDSAVSDEQIRNANLVLWGDPASNKVLAKIADKLPFKWTAYGVTVNGQTYPAGTHVPVLIYPNPLNPSRYVVLNSGFTFREYAQLNNARQVPMLPDYAVLDITTPPNSRYPGKVVRAGFFGERWQFLPDDGRGEK